MLVMVGNLEAFRRGVLGKDRKRNTHLQDFLLKEIQPKNDNQIKIEDFLEDNE